MLLRTAFLAAVVALAGCSVTVSVPGGAPPAIDAAGWTRSANYTTCDQWTGEMNAGQRLAMVRPILPILRRTVDTAATPGDELLPGFVDAVTAVCASEAVKAYNGEYVVTAAATVAFLDEADGRFRP